MMPMIFRITPTFIPTMEDIQLLLDGYILQKALYELGYNLNNRPDWI
jgi:maltose alpha-D-glucosyltransferase/alpha-amylase